MHEMESLCLSLSVCKPLLQHTQLHLGCERFYFQFLELDAGRLQHGRHSKKGTWGLCLNAGHETSKSVQFVT